MKQFLRSFLTLLMLVVWASGFAASGDIFTLVTAESELKAGDVIIIVNKNDSKALSTTQYEDNRAASAVTISGNDVKSADDTQEITLEGTSGAWYFNVGTGYLYAASSSANQLRTKTTKDSNSKAKITISSSSAKIQFQGNNTRNILQYNPNTSNAKPLFACYKSASQKPVSIYKKAASSKTPTTLTFDDPTISIEEGNEATFTGQTATLKANGTVLNNAITYTTNNDAMFEAYEANVGPKTLKAGAYGTATVTAKFNGDNTYEASTATYTVNYTEKEKPATTLDFGFTTKTVNIDETFTAAATLKSGETAITGKVTYSSFNSKVATVNEATGEVLALTAGKTTITATFAGTSEYKSSTASYDLTVVDPNATEVTFDFSKPDDYEYEVPGSGSATNLEEGDKIQSGVITITNIKSGKTGDSTNKARFHNKGGNITFRVYANGTISLSAQAGYTITKFAFESTKGGYFTVSSGTYNSATKTWEGNAQSITLTIPNGKDATWFQTMTVTYSKVGTTTPLTLDENADDTDTKIANNNGKTLDVALTRTLVANKWNTFCVPFDTEFAGTALEGATVKAVGTIEGNVINLVDATKIEAGVPYLVMPTTDDIVNPTFKNVTISVTTPVEKGNDEYKFVGTYSTKTITKGEFGTIWGVTDKGKLAKINEGTTMKGLRAYFVFPTNTPAAKLNFDGETTGINSIETETTVNGKVYNLNGQYVGNSLNGLKKGIYVVNGKKVIK